MINILRRRHSVNNASPQQGWDGSITISNKNFFSIPIQLSGSDGLTQILDQLPTNVNVKNQNGDSVMYIQKMGWIGNLLSSFNSQIHVLQVTGLSSDVTVLLNGVLIPIDTQYTITSDRIRRIPYIGTADSIALDQIFDQNITFQDGDAVTAYPLQGEDTYTMTYDVQNGWKGYNVLIQPGWTIGFQKSLGEDERVLQFSQATRQ